MSKNKESLVTFAVVMRIKAECLPSLIKFLQNYEGGFLVTTRTSVENLYITREAPKGLEKAGEKDEWEVS